MQVIVAAGLIYTKQPTDTTLTSRVLPTGITTRTPRPCATKLRRAGFINGRFDPALVYRDDLDVFYKAGIAPPVVTGTFDPPAFYMGNSDSPNGKVTGQTIGFFTWIHKDGSGNIISESGPATGYEPYPLTSIKEKRVWTTPTTAPDPRVNYKGLYAMWNGAAARHVADIPLATATYIEEFSPLNFGRLMEEGGDVPPYGTMCETHQQRVWVAGQPAHPDRISFSNFGDAESFNPDFYLQTTNGRAVTGIKRLGEVLVVFTATSTDIIVGNKPDNFTIIPKDPTIGCISHHSIVNIFNRLWFASQDGIRTYDGGFRYLMDNLRDYWHDEYEADPDAYEGSFAEVDFDTHSYLLTLDKATTQRFVGFYLPFEPAVGGGEGQPWWFIDQRTRKDTAMGRLTYATGTLRTRLITGSSDGYLRRENDYTNTNDDGDAFQKKVIIQPKHLFMSDPSGGKEGGKRLIKLHSYVESEDTTWSVEAVGGDESAENVMASQWVDTIPASAESRTEGGVTQTSVAKTIHIHDGVEKVSGRGFTFFYYATAPKNFKWRGLGGAYAQSGPGDFRGRAS